MGEAMKSPSCKGQVLVFSHVAAVPPHSYRSTISIQIRSSRLLRLHLLMLNHHHPTDYISSFPPLNHLLPQMDIMSYCSYLSGGNLHGILAVLFRGNVNNLSFDTCWHSFSWCWTINDASADLCGCHKQWRRHGTWQRRCCVVIGSFWFNDIYIRDTLRRLNYSTSSGLGLNHLEVLEVIGSVC